MTGAEVDRRDADWFRWAERQGIFETVADALAREMIRRAWVAAWTAAREYDRQQSGPG